MKTFERLPAELKTKTCISCGSEFIKHKDWGNKQWLRRKYCSSQCYTKASVGHSVSQETRRKLSIANTGQPGKVAWNKGIPNLAFHGEKNPNWKGGVSPINKKARETAEYREWRNAVFLRDDFTCVECGVRGGDLEADHIQPFFMFPELRTNMDNGRTLCKPCHRKIGWSLFRDMNPRKPAAATSKWIIVGAS